VLVPPLANPLPLLLAGVPFCHVPPLPMLVPPMTLMYHMHALKNCASPFKKKFCKQEKLSKIHSTTQKTFRRKPKKSMQSFNVGDVLAPKVESSSLRIGILLA
jgi:hypothetical protein